MKPQYQFPSVEEMDALRRQAILMRNEAMRDSFRALARAISAPFRGLFGRGTTHSSTT